jgi:menaquinone-dependent protoporphyrinogen oxidase
MRPILVVYATREGHTRKVADYIAARIRAHAIPVEVLDASEIPRQFPLDAYRAAVVCASIHVGVHEREIVRFVKAHRPELERMPTAFLSVSLVEAGAEDRKRSPADREVAAAEAQRMIEAFFANTGWRASIVSAVAGALMYSKYNWLVRWVMKRIARANNAPTDSSRDWVFTDWQALDRVAAALLARAGEAGGTDSSGRSASAVGAG